MIPVRYVNLDRTANRMYTHGMKPADEIRTLLREQLLTAFIDEYRDANDNWAVIDGKAQSTVTISGVFLAAAFAYAREIGTASMTERRLLACSVILLIAAVGVSLLALRLRRVSLPPFGTIVEQRVSDLLSNDNLNEDLLHHFLNERIGQWRLTVQTIYVKNDVRGFHAWCGQMLLGLALAPVAVFTILKILS